MPLETQLSAVARGLSASEVADRQSQGCANGRPPQSGRSILQIVRGNLLTRFNLLLGGLFAAMLAIGAVKDTLFIWVVVINLAVGIFQELRAKRTLDRLTIVDSAPVRVRRDGLVIAIAAEFVVADEVILVGRGEQLPVDGVVLESIGMEVDESTLTGEADAVDKPEGAQLLSGSVVVAGTGTLRATAVGNDAYARRLTTEAREFSLAGSELRAGTDRILRIVSWAMVPTAGLLLWSQLVSNESVTSAVQGTVAGVSAMVPEGLVLLTSMAFAAGVARLGRRNILTRELAAVEGLARVDLLFVDKTGTLTEPGMRVTTVEPLGTDPNVSEALAALAHLDGEPNPTLAAVAAAYPNQPAWQVVQVVAFTSQRRWSGATFAGHGSWVIGAPEAVLDPTDFARLKPAIERHTTNGARVLVLGCKPTPLGATEHPQEALHGLRPEALVLLTEQVKGDVRDTLNYFAAQGVRVKVLSGDNPATVAAIAAQAGVPSSRNPIDGSTLPTDPDELADIIENCDVFGRVGPEQKRAMVAAAQARGHVVAMTGDGVNDLLALKQADVGIAMGHGSGASRSAAQLVLLDGMFAALPAAVAEGRRVIANIERVAGLFVTKTVYALALALATGVARLPFPFLPRQLSLVGGLSIGIPGFLLALERNALRAQAGFVRRVLGIALPAGIIAAAATFAAYADARKDHATLAEARTTATVVLFVVVYWLLALVARPWSPARLAALAFLTTLFVAALVIPASRRYFEFNAPPLATWLTSGALAFAACGLLAVSLARSWARPQRAAETGECAR